MTKQFKNSDIAESFLSKNEVQDMHEVQDVREEQGLHELQGTYEAQGTHEVQSAYKVQGLNETQDVRDLQGIYEAQEVQDKKAKLPRMNMGFFEDNLEYIRVMSSIKGQSMTQYVNDLIATDKATNQNTYQKAKDLSRKV